MVFDLSNGATRHLQRRPPLRFHGSGRRAPSSRARRISRGWASSLSATSCRGEAIARLFAGKRTPLKAALLDQRLIAGLGNIYCREALFRAGLHPEARRRLDRDRDGAPRAKAASSREGIRDVLNEAVVAGGSTLRDYAQTDGTLGYFQHRFRVYDREGEPCLTPGCSGIVQRLVQSGRSTFYCPKCQRPAVKRKPAS